MKIYRKQGCDGVERDFKGVWISKEIWLDKNLGWSEKLLLVEINSLDNEEGCWATNDYFASFFGLSKGRLSKMISTLKDKGYISVVLIYKKGTKQIEKRIIHVNRYGQKQLEGIDENIDTPMDENSQDNNITSFNNSVSNSNYINYNTQNSKEILSANNEIFDFKILFRTIKKAYTEIKAKCDESDFLVGLSFNLSEYQEIFEYFYLKYEDYTGHSHPCYKLELIKEIMIKLPYTGGKTLDVDVDGVEDSKILIDAYFEQPWDDGVNPTMAHFTSGDIRELLFYKKLYY